MQYGIVYRMQQQGGPVQWFFLDQTGKHQPSIALVGLLNALAAQGWKIVAAGNFGGSGEDEIVVEHA